jgi:hypothetical protein
VKLDIQVAVIVRGCYYTVTLGLPGDNLRDGSRVSRGGECDLRLFGTAASFAVLPI